MDRADTDSSRAGRAFSSRNGFQSVTSDGKHYVETDFNPFHKLGARLERNEFRSTGGARRLLPKPLLTNSSAVSCTLGRVMHASMVDCESNHGVFHGNRPVLQPARTGRKIRGPSARRSFVSFSRIATLALPKTMTLIFFGPLRAGGGR
jgi:hypothetical protein